MTSARVRSEADIRHGAVFTRRWVVELILDLSGYQVSTDLTRQTIVEPSVGDGGFLVAIIDRLLTAREKHAPETPWADLADCVRAWDLQEQHVRTARTVAREMLSDAGCPRSVATRLVQRWLVVGDFLLTDLGELQADYVVGNPPYVRIEDLDPAIRTAYRHTCRTMVGRADIYVGFYERALDLLREGGKLAFICADRWMRNDYGRGLRAKITNERFAMDVVLVMHDAAAFESDVSAYPAVTVIRRGPERTTAIADASAHFGPESAHEFAGWVSSRRKKFTKPAVRAARLPHWHTTAESWPDGSPELLDWLDDLAERFPLVEDTDAGTRIGIGVATGADSVYVVGSGFPRTAVECKVEPGRLLALSHADDVKSGVFSWTGRQLVNPWSEAGLVDLAVHPGLNGYLTAHKEKLHKRSVVRNMSTSTRMSSWHRTIDRVNTGLLDRAMLVMEDMKAHASPVLVPAGFYPHHGLYYIVSDTWDLEVLGGLLLSSVVERQVAAFCVKMRGNTLRFQAQYLRRIRCPRPDDVPADVRAALVAAFRSRDRDAATKAALVAYGLTSIPQ